MNSSIPSNGMSWKLVVALAVGTAALGCGHTRIAGDAGAASAKDKRPGEGAQNEREGQGDHPHRVTRRADVPIKSDTRAGAPPLATSPAGLLKPEAISTLQDKLVSKGALSKKDESGKLDGPTRVAMRAFQRQSNLPATGVPDDLTVRKLGLDPGRIFRAAGKPGGGAN